MLSLFGRGIGIRALAQVAILPLRASHAPDCCKLHAPAFAHPWSTADFEALLLEKSTLADGAFAKGLAGFCLSRLAGDEAEILTVVVDSAQRKHGIGQQLLVTHLGHVAAKGVRRLFLEVDDQNVQALKLYACTGFAEVGKRPAYYRQVDGRRTNALILRCDLA